MVNKGKIALKGLSDFTLAPVTKNDDWNYETGEQFALPGVKRLSMEQDVSRETVWADNQIYLDMYDYNGTKVTIAITEVDLELLVKLGFGSFDEDGAMFWNPIGKQKEFCLSFACLQANDEYRMYKMFVFTVNEIRETALSTTGGDSSGIAYYELEGMFVPRKVDNKPALVMDGEDLSWLKEGAKAVLNG